MDWNNDGVPDLIFGEREGHIRIYTGNGDGTLHFRGYLHDSQGDPIKCNYNSSPWLVDWNGNGKLDLLFAGYETESTYGGFLRVYPNTGDDPDSLVFSPDFIDYSGFYNRWRTTAQTFDLNGDGRKDLILGYEMGEVYFAPNTGTNENPQFSSYDVLQCDAGPINVYTNFSGGGRARPHVFDYNSDGIPDLLVGCNNGWIYVFLGHAVGIEGEHGNHGAALSLTVLRSPARGFVPYEITLPEGMNAKLTVYDIAGRPAREFFDISGGSGVMNLQGMPTGVYILTAECGVERASEKFAIVR